MRALELLRAQGVKAGLFRPITLWPFPEQALQRVASRARAVLVPEMNHGQMILEVERIVDGIRVAGLNRVDGEAITPAQIAERTLALQEDR